MEKMALKTNAMIKDLIEQVPIFMICSNPKHPACHAYIPFATANIKIHNIFIFNHF